MKRYLVLQSVIAIGPKADEDFGVINKFLSSDENITKLDGQTVQNGVLTDETDASEDGYVYQAESYEVREITEDQYQKFKTIIKEYNSIGDSTDWELDEDDSFEISYDDIVDSESDDEDEEWDEDDDTFDDEELEEDDSEKDGESVYEDDEIISADFEDEDVEWDADDKYPIHGVPDDEDDD